MLGFQAEEKMLHVESLMRSYDEARRLLHRYMITKFVKEDHPVTMAETMAGPFVTFVVERLGDVLIQKKNLLRGVSSQVEEMQRELNRMKCFLKDAAEKREEGDERVHNWVAEIREATYDAEAVIYTYIIKVAFRRKTGSILNVLMRYSCVFKFKDSIAIHKVGVEIESIKANISKITTSLDTYGVRAISEEESSRFEKQRLLRQSYPHIVEEDIVGLDDDIKTVAEHLVKEERQCRVVSIWGMGGLGKTTLAKKVYHYIDVRRHFDCFAWAFISQQCNTREVLEGILIELTSPSHEERTKIKTMSHGQLVVELCRVQSQKKCLVVIDDIWRDEDWKILSPAFPNKKVASSKILLTTRIQAVASYADQRHELRHLTELESWELFGRKAFSRRNVTAFDNQQLKWENSASSSSSSPLTKIRRLAVYYLGDHDANNIRREFINLEELPNHHHLRSCQFYFFGNGLEISGWEQIKSLLKGFKLLRILDVDSMKIRREEGMLPRDIGNLFHLRYLNIKDSYIKSVPSSIGNLRFLQTLDLRTNDELEIPNVLWSLEQLRHLCLPRRIKLTGTSLGIPQLHMHY
ncbi:putative disease resistance protein [Camellia lanceoleosa]|uniref:Disease resistance protein n=1 Tax=Camellia lanceoleosa TaxID=1840588 RepID=A0ACC0IPI5_9ERIC|nr:putative disease resistance protein [Camellia lanceoleosa]